MVREERTSLKRCSISEKFKILRHSFFTFGLFIGEVVLMALANALVVSIRLSLHNVLKAGDQRLKNQINNSRRYCMQVSWVERNREYEREYGVGREDKEAKHLRY